MDNDVSVPAAADAHVAPAERSRFSFISKFTRWHTTPRLIGYARITYLVGLALALLLASPVTWIPTPLLKIAIFSVVLAVTAILFVLGGGLRELWRAPGRTWALTATLALPVVYLLSWWYSVDRSLGLTGVGNEVDTILTVVLASMTLLLGFGLFRTLKSVKQLIGTIGITVLIAGAFQYVSILLGSYILPAAFSDKSVNLIGKWNDFGMLMSIGLLFLLARLELGDEEGWKRYARIAGLVLLAILIVLVQFSFIWWFTLAGAAVIGLLKWLPRLHSDTQGSLPVQPSRIPWFAGVTVIVCLVFAFFGTAIATHLPGFLSVPSLEVRPGFSTTIDISSAAHQGAALRPMLGSGPNTFVNEWITNKPLSVNQTPFWNIDFITGFSVLTTAFASSGLLGLLAWLIPMVLVVMSLWQLRTINRLPLDDRLMLLSIGLASVFLWVGIVLYAGSQDMVFLAFALAGALWATEAAARRPVIATAPAPSKRWHSGAMAAGAFVLVLVALWPAFGSPRQFLSYTYEQLAAQALSQQDILSAAQLDDSSQQVLLTGDNLRLGIAIDFAQMQKLAQASTTPATIDGMRQQFQAALQTAIAQGQRATLMHPNDYQAYAQLGQVYEFLVPLKVQGAVESANAAYTKAQEINPTNPTLPLLQARLGATSDLSGNLKEIGTLLNKSLSIKPNYTDAFLFAEQLAVSQNDLPTATQAAEAVVASNQQDPASWFQLGLFFYAGKDWQDALKAFQNAVSLQSNYANAKYFLGLTDYKLGDTQGAIAQFTDLAGTNPDNAEVKLVLGNMQAGKDPFANETPPQPPPEKRTTAPVKETAPATNQ